MHKSRLQKLEEFARRHPEDPFSHYGLAMEYKSAGKPDKAAEVFSRLLKLKPDYTPAYFQYGMVLRDTGQNKLAGSVFAKGIEVASQNGDQRAVAELEAALAEEL